MKKTVIFLFFAVLLQGCASPKETYNFKAGRVKEFHRDLRKNTAMSIFEVEKLYWMEVKKEFPEYGEDVDYILRIIQKHKEIKDSGQSLTEDDKKEYLMVFDKFWEGALADYRFKQSKYEDRQDFLNALSQGLNQFSREMNENTSNMRRSEINRLDNKIQQNRPIHCTTNFIGSTAYTNCY